MLVSTSNDYILSFRLLSIRILGTQLNETVMVQTDCPGQTIVDFITASPYGMTHSNISNPSASELLILTR